MLSRWKYDVFLSFRGEDTRKSFADHLYAALNRKGIFVFRDDKELRRGNAIPPELFKAIEESRFSMIVFSKNYAHSTWCLDELVKIVESDQRMIFPIFYDVEPTVVRKQSGNFKEAFDKHEEAFRENIKKVQKWRKALEKVANSSGWKLNDRNESEFIEEIAEEISSKLIPKAFEIHKQLVGINSRLEGLMFLLDKGYKDVRMIGICGMGGQGKTTIARVVYDLISWQFEGSSFVADVRETCGKSDLVSLQKQLLYELLKMDNNIWNIYDGINMIGSRLQRKMVLIVIDDVVDVRQLESLVGKHNWFGSGSRIIITSRNEHLLRTHGVNEVYKLDGLNVDEAQRLFCLKAFKSDEPMKDYKHLSERVVEYAAGLPLALTVLGSFLFGKTVKEWESALKRLKRGFENEILDILQLSFDGLKETEKQIFLDIACFFKGKDRDYVIDVLEGFDFEPVIGIRVLVEKSLISINNNILWMHDLLQDMGHRIVKEESKEPGKRSRLWEEVDVHHVLSKNMGTEVIEAIKFDIIKEKRHLTAKKISKMANLRLLQISNVQLPELHMYDSSIKQLWRGMKRLKMLKVMILSHCQNLTYIPDFTRITNLEEFFVIGCSRLQEIHPSLLVHKKLTILYIKDCTSLESLPGKIDMSSLKKLVLSGCSKLKNFPEIRRNMKRLSELSLDRTAITELPTSIKFIYGLCLLSLKDCKNFVSLPSTINGLKCLEILNLSGCSKLKKVPEILARLKCLLKLLLDGTAVTEITSPHELPSSLVLLSLKECKNLESIGSVVIARLKCLQTLNLSGCSRLRKFPEIVERMECLSEISLGGTAIEELSLPFKLLPCFNNRRLSTTIKSMKSLKTLDLAHRSEPENLMTPRSSFFNWMPRRCSHAMVMLMSPLSVTCFLTKLDLSGCNLGEGAISDDICYLFSLKTLNLSKNNFVSLPETISLLSKLKDLLLGNCKRLESLPKLPSNIENVKVDGCSSLDTLSRVRVYILFNLYTINCLKSVGSNNLTFTMLEGSLEADSKPETKRSFTSYGGAEACDDEEPKPKRLREPKLKAKRCLTDYAGEEACDDEETQPKRIKRTLNNKQ